MTFLALCHWFKLSIHEEWKILFYPPNTGTFYQGSTNIDTVAQYPKFNTEPDVSSIFQYQYFMF